MTALATVHLGCVETTVMLWHCCFSKTGTQRFAGALRQLTCTTGRKSARVHQRCWHAEPEAWNGQQYRRYVETQMGAYFGQLMGFPRLVMSR
jgi:hypothetical protein